MRWLAVIAIGAALAGCVPAQSQMSWMRTDGEPVDEGFHIASARCREVAAKVGRASPEAQRSDLMAAAMQGCMLRQGYAWRCLHPLASLYDGKCLELPSAPPLR
jgi:hypothetical protein